MLSKELEQELESLSKKFNKATRTWKGCSTEFDNCASKLNKYDFELLADDIKENLSEKLNQRFTIKELRSYPAPTIGQYVANAIRNIRNRY